MTTDRPNHATSDSTTVPTMTNDAISARVMISITTTISVIAPTATISRSHFGGLYFSVDVRNTFRGSRIQERSTASTSSAV
jgi:hypothetical protein